MAAFASRWPSNATDDGAVTANGAARGDHGALALSVEHLDVSVPRMRPGPARILSDVSVSAREGEIVAVVGESGCGKSTLASAITGLLPPAVMRTAGRILLDGDDIAGLPEKELRKYRGRVVGYIPQDHIGAFNPVLTVERHLVEGPMTHLGLSRREARRRAAGLLEMVRLDEPTRILCSYPHQLSGGMRQRVMIAAAMSCGPKLLVADEPTTALDVTVQAEILKLLRDLCLSQGTGLVLISHDLSVVGGVADRVVVLYSGEVVEEGPTSLLLGTPSHPYTRALLRAVPDPGDPQARTKPLAAIAGRPPDIANRPAGCWFHPRCPYAMADDECSRTHPDLMKTGEDRAVRTFHPCPAGKDEAEAPGGTAASADPPRPADAALLAGAAARTALLQVENLTKSYGQRGAAGRGHRALDSVSLSVESGQTFGLIGESGSGKSTLAHCVLQLTKPYSGTVIFDGRPLEDISGGALRKLRQDLQPIFQDARNSLEPKMTVGAAVEEALHIHEGRRSANSRARALEALRQVGLGETIAQRYPKQCSGGELQRACIARALVLRPKLLICDEAVSSLDVSSRAQVLNLLRELQSAEEISLLFITHDFGAVTAMSDVVGVLNRGRLVECGAAAAVLRRPSHTYTKQLLGAVPRLLTTPT